MSDVSMHSPAQSRTHGNPAADVTIWDGDDAVVLEAAQGDHEKELI